MTEDLAEQVFSGLETLLKGFQTAAERDKSGLLREALERDEDHLYRGLLTVMLRLVFILYAEDRGLLPRLQPERRVPFPVRINKGLPRSSEERGMLRTFPPQARDL